MQFSMPSVDEFVDLDNFLDSYLTQLHNDRPGAGPVQGLAGLQNPGGLQPMQTGGPQAMSFDQPGAAQQGAQSLGMLGQMPTQGLPGYGAGLAPGLNAGFPGLQAPMQANYAAPGLGGLSSNFGAGGLAGMPGLAGLVALQQQQQQQGQMGLMPGAGPATSAHHTAATGTRGGGVSKPATRGRGGTRGGKGGRGGGNNKSEADQLSTSDHEDNSGSGSDGGGAENKPRKKQLTTDEAERRHLALQEKNRRAQRRFRERQKNKLTDLHRQIEELTTRVSSLQNENAALHSRTSILEKVLDMRNEQIQVMQETKESTQYPGGDEELLQLQDVGGQLVQLSPEMIKELSSDQIYKIYQMYVKELSSQLQDAAPTLTNGATAAPSEGSSGGAAGAGAGGAVGTPAQGGDQTAPASPELEKLVKDLSLMIMRLGVVKPLETRKFIVVSRQYLGSSEAEVIELWRNVMRAIDLSEQQKREVVELKRMFLQKIEPIMEERKHLNVQIQANLPHDTFHTKNALTYIKAHEAVIKLRNNLRAEQHVVLEFAIAVFRGVFRPRQMATLLVKCYPAVPDALGIASALAAELGEPESPASRALAVQLGGYLEGGGGNVLGTNMMTLQYPSLTQHQMAQAAVAGAGAAAAAAAATVATATVPRLGAGPSGLGLPGAGGAAAGFPGAGAGADQFGNWMARPAGPNELMNLAASGNAPIVSLLHQGGAAGSGGLGGAAPAPQ